LRRDYGTREVAGTLEPRIHRDDERGDPLRIRCGIHRGRCEENKVGSLLLRNRDGIYREVADVNCIARYGGRGRSAGQRDFDDG
jgi:hypothetical protein